MFGWFSRRAGPSVGFFGKIPAEGDFVGANTKDPIIGALDGWLQESIEKLRGAGAALPAEPVRFLFRTAEPKQALTGVLGASRDSVGREFPLVIFSVEAAARLAKEYPHIPLTHAGFFDAAVEVLRAAAAIEVDELSDRVSRLAPTDAAAAGGGLEGMLAATRTDSQWEQLFGTPGKETKYYAFSTFVSACKPMQREDPGKAGAMLDCPIAGAGDVLFWLDLARSLLGWRKLPPSFFWTAGSSPRFLLSLGPAPSIALLCLSRPSHDAPRLWPLRTEDATAREAARSSFDEAQRKVIEQDSVSNEALIASLARG